jgi:hypothetical protein
MRSVERDELRCRGGRAREGADDEVAGDRRDGEAEAAERR